MAKKYKYLLGGIGVLVFVIVFIIVYYRLMFNENYIPGNIDKILRNKAQITDSERLPVESFINSINDYKTEIELLPEWSSAVVVRGEEVLTSDNLSNISEMVLAATNKVYDTDYAIDQLYIEVSKDKIIYYFWMEKFFYFIEYDINGDIIKRISTRRLIPLKDNEITYAYFNTNNDKIEKLKMISYAYRKIDYVKIGFLVALGSIIVSVLNRFIYGLYKRFKNKQSLN